MAIVIQKFYEAKVYRAGVYIGNYSRDEIISDVELSNQLNTAGGQLVIKLARPSDSYGEASDVDFNLQVKVYCYDSDAPNGTLVFTGFIADYAPIYGGTDSEHVEVTLLGYGAELDDYIIQAGENLDQSNTTTNANHYNFSSNGTYVVGQSFVPGSTGKISRIELTMSIEGFIWTTAQVVTLTLYSGSPATSKTLIGSTTATVSSSSDGVVSFAFSTPISVISGQTYYFELVTVNASGGGAAPVYILYNSTSAYASGQVYTASKVNYQASPQVYTAQTSDLWFKVYQSTGNTTAPFTSVDPSTILKTLLDDYKSRGGSLSYDNTTIDLTGTVVTYTFNTNTMLEGLNKVLELAPQGWYFYIDQATNMVHFHQMVSSPTYRFTLGKDITALKVEKRTENLVNTVYFTGGDTGAGILYKVYRDTASIALYGQKLQRYTDQRVTVSATADIIANTIINNGKAPEIRTTLDIVDNAGDPNTGYDLESIKLGDVVSFANFGNWVPSLWDIGTWDNAYWDYNVQQLETLALQIVRLDYKPDKITLSLSTVQPDVNKRIEDINRQLQDTLTLKNPSAPA